jgi:cystathionine beta-lyase
MIQDFDKIINREGTNSYKYDLREKMFGTTEVYPMWVADTEFAAPAFVLESIQKRLNHGVLGYTILDDTYPDSIINWLEKLHGWKVKREWIKYSPGVVPSLYACVMALTRPGEKVIVQTPVYYPFYSAIRDTGRELIKNPLKLVNGRYQMDLDDLKAKIDNQTRMIFLCSPHNPTGNVWKKEELLQLAEICIANKIILVSDEIHADIVYKNYKHYPTASLSEEIAARTITLMAPSKTFNIAGLNSSYIIASDTSLLKQVTFYFEGIHIGPNIPAIEATKAAYNFGYQWLQELLAYYSGNILLVKEFLKTSLPQIELIEPEGTFLLWLDFKNLNLSHDKLRVLLVQKAGIGLSDGIIFGPEGKGFQRMNIGCSRLELEKALLAMAGAIKTIAPN